MKLFPLLSIMLYATDCDLTMNFLRSLNLHMTDPIEFNLIPQNCCNYQSSTQSKVFQTYYTQISINCTSTSVTSIQLVGTNINGTLNATSLPKNLYTLKIYSNLKLSTQIPENLPSSISTLHLSSNKLYGPIPSTLPSNLTTLMLYGNVLNGSIPLLPPKVTTLYLLGNSLSGDIPNNLPSGLKEFRGFNNLFTGSVNNFPDSLNILYMDSNYFSGSVERVPNQITYYSFSYNLLSGELPTEWPLSLNTIYFEYNSFASVFPYQLLQQITELGIIENQFTGCLNVTIGCTECRIWANKFQGPAVFKKPNFLDASVNMITDVTILDTSILNMCYLEYNPMLNANGLQYLPAKCQKGNLFANNGYQCTMPHFTSKLTSLAYSSTFKSSSMMTTELQTTPFVAGSTKASTLHSTSELSTAATFESTSESTATFSNDYIKASVVTRIYKLI
eukprot:NODE_738_length_4335_cov_0.481350.p1 type:complete len:447 gc:universal NODE_738_length_4335_cov_0.481350:2220-880(-)